MGLLYIKWCLLENIQKYRVASRVVTKSYVKNQVVVF